MAWLQFLFPRTLDFEQTDRVPYCQYSSDTVAKVLAIYVLRVLPAGSLYGGDLRNHAVGSKRARENTGRHEESGPSSNVHVGRMDSVDLRLFCINTHIFSSRDHLSLSFREDEMTPHERNIASTPSFLHA